MSAALAQTHPTAIEQFKNAYTLEFLDLGAHLPAEKDLLYSRFANTINTC